MHAEFGDVRLKTAAVTVASAPAAESGSREHAVLKPCLRSFAKSNVVEGDA